MDIETLKFRISGCQHFWVINLSQGWLQAFGISTYSNLLGEPAGIAIYCFTVWHRVSRKNFFKGRRAWGEFVHSKYLLSIT